MKLLHFASVLASASLFTSPVLAVTAGDIFQTIPSPTDGNCAEQNVDLMVQEAITLNTKAIKALDTLTQDKLLSILGEEGRLSQVAAAIWGVWRMPDFGFTGAGIRFNDNDKALLNKAKEYYEEANTKLLSGNNNDAGKLSCGTGDWLYAADWKALGYPDRPWKLPNGGKFVSKYFSQKELGQYPMTRDTIMTDAVIHGHDYSQTGFCDGKTQGLTIASRKYITMCDSSFKDSTLTDLLMQQSTWTSGQKIDDLNTAGADFQHEMFHYINQGIVDKLTPGGNRAYGWANCALLAAKSDEGVESAQLYNADNYRLFALAVFFDRTWWNAQGQKY